MVRCPQSLGPGNGHRVRSHRPVDFSICGGDRGCAERQNGQGRSCEDRAGFEFVPLLASAWVFLFALPNSRSLNCGPRSRSPFSGHRDRLRVPRQPVQDRAPRRGVSNQFPPVRRQARTLARQSETRVHSGGLPEFQRGGSLWNHRVRRLLQQRQAPFRDRVHHPGRQASVTRTRDLSGT